MKFNTFSTTKISARLCCLKVEKQGHLITFRSEIFGTNCVKLVKLLIEKVWS